MGLTQETEERKTEIDNMLMVDDDLTNLTWLQDENLLRNLSMSTDTLPGGSLLRLLKDDNDENQLPNHHHHNHPHHLHHHSHHNRSYHHHNHNNNNNNGNHHHHLDHDNNNDSNNESINNLHHQSMNVNTTNVNNVVVNNHLNCSSNNNNNNNSGESTTTTTTLSTTTKTVNQILSVPPVPYNPQVHIHAKPPYSFSSLIFMAIESSTNKALPVKDIYSWIVEHFPYYRNAAPGWKNTVRHNLSLNKCFRKVDKAKDDLSPIGGKGSLWCVDPDLRPNLLQAVRRTPAHIYPYLSTVKSNLINGNSIQITDAKQSVTTPLIINEEMSQEKFPLLTKRLLIPISQISRESEEADAAESMLTLTQYSSSNNIIIIENNREEPNVATIENIVQNNSINSMVNDHNYFSKSKQAERDKVNSNRNYAVDLEDVVINDGDTVMVDEEDDDDDDDEEEEEEDDEDVRHHLDNNVNYVNRNETNKIIIDERSLDEIESDEDGVKGAKALLKLASRSTNKHVTVDRHLMAKRIRVSCD